MLKRKRWQSPDYLSFVRKLPCSVCGLLPVDGGPNDAHHCIGSGLGGMGTKAADWAVLPLCRPCHNDLHNCGAKVWEDRNGPQSHYALKTMGAYIESRASE